MPPIFNGYFDTSNLVKMRTLVKLKRKFILGA